MPCQNAHLAGLLGSPAEGLGLLQVLVLLKLYQGTAAMSIAVMPLAKRHTLDSSIVQVIPDMLTSMHSNEIPMYKICVVSMTTVSIAQVMPIDMLCRHR